MDEPYDWDEALEIIREQKDEIERLRKELQELKGIEPEDVEDMGLGLACGNEG